MLRALKQRWRRHRLHRHGIRESATGTREALDAWWVAPDLLGPDSAIYCFGVGTNLRFDLALIERFGATVHAFDPTPVSVDWVAQQTLPEQLRFHALGVAGHDGSISFFPPRKASGAHFSPVRRYDKHTEADLVELPVERLGTIAARLGHDALDLVKIDIEGGEYDVLDDLLDVGPRPRQLLVEFHHNYKTISFERTRDACARLGDAGYECFHISQRTYEMSFVRSGS